MLRITKKNYLLVHTHYEKRDNLEDLNQGGVKVELDRT